MGRVVSTSDDFDDFLRKYRADHTGAGVELEAPHSINLSAQMLKLGLLFCVCSEACMAFLLEKLNN